MKNYYNNLLTVAATLLFCICSYSQNYEDGIFILNEGMIGTETASVSFLNSNGALENNVFSNQPNYNNIFNINNTNNYNNN